MKLFKLVPACTIAFLISPNMAAMAQGQAGDESVEEIVVTGSRIRRSNVDTPIPITTVDARDIQNSGRLNLVDVLKQTPALLNSTNLSMSIQDAAAGSETVSGSSGGLAVGLSLLDLRSLGTKRTLVLVDGRRHVGSRAGDTAVDVGTIPSALVERVEVMTGGASAIYGADAVSGVVNFIMKKNYEGIDFSAQANSSAGGDATGYTFALAAGTNYANDRGNVTFAVNYTDEGRVACGDRSFCRDNGIEADLSNSGSGADRIYRPQATFSISSQFGRIGYTPDGTVGSILCGTGPDCFSGGFDANDDPLPPIDANDVGFFVDANNDGINDVGTVIQGGDFGFGDWVFDDTAGTFRLFENGDDAGCCNQFGGDGIQFFDDGDTLSPDYESISLNSSVNYAITDSVNFFAEGKYSHSESNVTFAIATFNDQLIIRSGNPWMPAELQTAMDNAVAAFPGVHTDPAATITNDVLGLQASDEALRDTYRIVTGFDGDFDNGLAWEVSYNYGRTQEVLKNHGERINDRFYAAIDALTDPATGEPVCRSTLFPDDPPPATSPFPFTDPGFFTFAPGDGQCQPFNLFGANRVRSQASLDFVTMSLDQTSIITQQVISGILDGDSAEWFELPAGAIGFAVGAEYREETSSFAPSGMQIAGLNFDGTRVTGVDGKYDVTEFFGEVVVPLLSDMAFAQDLTIDGAVRFADYSTIGDATSWKTGLNWQIADSIRFRGTYSVAVRAPNVGELFQSPTAAFFRPIDPCDVGVIPSAPDPAVRQANCTADGLPAGFIDPLTGRFSGTIGGNEFLSEEEATTFTVGLVYTPGFLDGFSATLDYWNIELVDAIETISSQQIVNNCYDDPGGIDNQFCANIGRHPGTSPTPFGLNFLNQGLVNIGERLISGVDFDLLYSYDMQNAGGLDFQIQGTWIEDFDDVPNQDEPGLINQHLKELRNPEWAVNTTITWYREKLEIGYRMRYLSEQIKQGALAGEVFNTLNNPDFVPLFVNPFTGTSNIHDLFANYALNDNFTITGGINNVADEDPFLASTAFPTGPQGRMIFFRLSGAY